MHLKDFNEMASKHLTLTDPNFHLKANIYESSKFKLIKLCDFRCNGDKGCSTLD